MYWRHLDLSAEPFSLTPDPAFLYLSSVHAEAYAALTVGLRERRGLIAMIGEVGTGKTTLVYSLLSGLGPEIHTAYISNARLSFDGILRSALRDFGVDCESLHVSELLDAFNRFLNRCAEDGTTAALVIDEAQNLSRDTFEDLRLLTNFETYKHKLLQIVLVGQPELDTKLRDPALRQVADRIAVRCHVNPLTPQEVRQYIQHRLAAAGGSIEIFSEGALRILVRRSRGIPRSINILGHNAMLFAYGAGRTRVTRGDALSAIREREGRDLVRLESRWQRWLSWLSPASSSANGILSYPRVLMIGLTVAAVAFVVTATLGTARREASTDEAIRAPTDAVAAPSKRNVRSQLPASDEAAARVAKPTEPDNAGLKPEAVPVTPEPPQLDDAAIPEQKAEAAAPRLAAPANSPAENLSARRDSEASANLRTEQTAPVHSQAAPQPAAALDIPMRSGDVAGVPEPAVANGSDSKPVETSPAASKKPSAADAGGVSKGKKALKGRRSTKAAEAETRDAGVADAATIPNADPAIAYAQPTQALSSPDTTSDTSPAGTADVAGTDVRVVEVRPGNSLSDLITAIYGIYDPRFVPRIQAMNPQLKNPDVIMVGDRLRFPDQGKAAPAQQSGSRR